MERMRPPLLSIGGVYLEEGNRHPDMTSSNLENCRLPSRHWATPFMHRPLTSVSPTQYFGRVSIEVSFWRQEATRRLRRSCVGSRMKEALLRRVKD